jgi:hypothetical protein
MTLSPTSRVFSYKRPSRLGTYLATAVGSCGLATLADGAIVNIDLTNVQGNNITGTNGGVAAGNFLTINDWLGAGTGTLEIYNGPYGYTGLDADDSLLFAIFDGDASPNNFGSGSTIDSSATWSGSASRTVFKYYSDVSANFDAPSFMGFRFGSGSSWNYGYLGVTWDGTNFQLLSGAYESTLNTPILAGATAVPEPTTGALAALVLGGAALGVARRRRKQEAAATSEQAV